MVASEAILVVGGTDDRTIGKHCTREEMIVDGEFQEIRWLLTEQPTFSELKRLFEMLLPGGRLVMSVFDASKPSANFILAGFLKPINDPSSQAYIFRRPTFGLGSSVPLKDMIDEDSLLKEEDKVRPNNSTAAACGSELKRKACKDCTCGLADKETTLNTANAKSSCGSCHLGDAFRCGGCPYRGLPAFKPGEQVQMPASFLDDGL